MYTNLKLSELNFNINNNINLNVEELINIMEECYSKTGFSTFGYIFEQLDSYECIKKYNSANCIGLSIYVQNKLKKKNIISYLIPASIPNIYKMPEYLNISHVALFIPHLNKGFVIDCAFYFLSPIEINFKLNKTSNIMSKSIYDKEEKKDLINYTSLNIIKSNLKKTDTQEILNEYQFIPSNTFYVECNYNNNINDKWNYYLVNIINPDEAITSFFINIKKNPFICTACIDSNGIPKCKYYIKFNDNNILFKKNGNSNLYTPNEFINSKYINLKKINYYFNNNLYKFVKDYYNI